MAARISSVCSPSAGGGRSIRAGVAESLTGKAICGIWPSVGWLRLPKSLRCRTWGSCGTSSSRRTGPEEGAELPFDPLPLVAGRVLEGREVLATRQSAEVPPELGLEGPEGDVATIGRLVDAIADPAAVQALLAPDGRPTLGKAEGEVGREPGDDAVRHRHVHELALAGILPVVEGRGDPEGGEEGAAPQVRGLDAGNERRPAPRPIHRERAGHAHVV